MEYTPPQVFHVRLDVGTHMDLRTGSAPERHPR
jgi:hypothetical protein